MDRITHSVLVKKKKGSPPLTLEERRFCDLILEGYSNINAIFESGIGDRDRSGDKEYRKKMGIKAKALMNTRRVRDYLYANRKCAVVFTPTDMEKVATRMMDICMGNATMETEKVVDGEVVKIEERPTFKDQIGAANFLMKYTEMLKSTKRLEMTVKAEDVDKDALDFVNRYKTRPIEDGVFMNANGTEKEIRRVIDEMDD